MTRFAVETITSLTSRGTKLRALANNALRSVAEAQEETVKHIIEDAIKNYDTAEPGETYERTGDMGGSWKYEQHESGGEVTTVIYNDVTDDYERHYSGLVQGDEQTLRHEGAGWHTIHEIRNDHLREQTNRVRAAINRAGR